MWCKPAPNKKSNYLKMKCTFRTLFPNLIKKKNTIKFKIRFTQPTFYCLYQNKNNLKSWRLTWGVLKRTEYSECHKFIITIQSIPRCTLHRCWYHANNLPTASAIPPPSHQCQDNRPVSCVTVLLLVVLDRSIDVEDYRSRKFVVR